MLRAFPNILFVKRENLSETGTRGSVLARRQHIHHNGL